VTLGINNAIDLTFDDQYYLGVNVNGDGEMLPRAVLVSVPYAMRAGTADTAVSAQTADTAVTLEDKTLSDLVALLDGRYGNLGDSLIADFSAAPTSIYRNQSVNFTDLSLGVPSSWLWDFGDSSTSTLQNPLYTYTAPGIYTVALTAQDDVTSNKKMVTDYITVLEIAPDFTADRTAIALNETVNFTDLTQGVPISWSWDFGDSGTSTLQNPSYDYTSGGTYTVSLTVDDGVTLKTETKTDYITYYLLPRGTIQTVHATGTVGYSSSIAIGADNLPVISYYDGTNGDLKVAHCGIANCSSGNTIYTVDSAGAVGSSTSIAIGADGLPVISYYDATNKDLKVAHCGNAACSSGNTINTVDSGGTVGMYTSIAIGADNLPVISYYDGSSLNLKVAHCGDASCSSGNTITTVDSAGNVGEYTSIAIGADGLPIISYYYATNWDLKVAHCGIANCSSGNTITTVDSTGSVGYHTSIAMGADNLPVISYWDATNGDLKAAHCGNAACSSGNTTATVDATGSVGRYHSIAIGADNLPVISYYDLTNMDLKVAHCGIANCSSGNTIYTVASVGDIIPTSSRYNSITIGADSLPVMSYYDFTNNDLKVAHCGDAECTLWP
jgi:PKD repeat protein